MGRKVLWVQVLAVVLVLWSVGVARANLVLKPRGENALPLRAKELKANVVIEGQFATTQVWWTFQNELAERTEADFLYSAPPGSVVTGFAYWYGDEKVVARVVDKARAAAIYKHITSRQRDPALIEMIGANTFRARIFPIEANADLKIEIQMVQALPSRGSGQNAGAFWEFPLREALGRSTRLEKLDMTVDVRPDKQIVGVRNSLGSPITRDEKGWHWKLSQQFYRVPDKVRFDLKRAPRAVQISTIAAPAGGRDGFATIALTPNQNLTNARLRISGAQTYDVIDIPKTIRAGQQVLWCGRYRGGVARNATVMLSGTANGSSWSAGQNVTLNAERREPNAAAKLWASKRIESLGESARQRATIVALSKRFGLPSRWTSWLAVPKAELERYREEIKMADLSVLGRRIALEAARGRSASSLKRQFRADAKRLNVENADSQLATYFDATLRELSFQRSEAHLGARPSARRVRDLNAQIARLQRSRRRDFKTRASSGEPIYIVEDDLRVASREWLAAVDKSGENSQRARLMEQQLKTLAKGANGYGWQWDTFISEALQARIEPLARAVLDEQSRETPDAARLKNLNAQLKRWATRAHSSSEDAISGQKANWARDEMNQVLGEIVVAADAPRPDAAKVQKLLARHRKLLKDNFGWPEPNVSSQIEDNLRELQLAPAKIADGKVVLPPAKLSELERGKLLAQLQNLKFSFSYGSGQGGDPLLLVTAPRDAQQVIAILPNGDIKRLVWNEQSGRWEARFDIPMGTPEGDFAVTVVIVDKVGARHHLTLNFRVDVSAPNGQGSAQIVTNQTKAEGKTAVKWRLEVKGDSDTARVFALLPWGEKIELSPSTIKANTFFALVDVPAGVSANGQVSYLLTDSAHNRSAIAVDVEP